MKKIYPILLVIFLTLTSCGKNEPTLQQLVDTNFLNKQLKIIEDKLQIQALHIEGHQKKSYEYEIQKCKVKLYTDYNQNIIGYHFPISNTCPFKMELGNIKFPFDSKKSTLRQIINKAPKNCNALTFSSFCLGFCGVSNEEPKDSNYVELDGGRPCYFDYVKFQFDENQGIRNWKVIVKKDMEKFGIIGTGMVNNFWGTYGSKYNPLGEVLWDDVLPNSITNMNDIY